MLVHRCSILTLICFVFLNSSCQASMINVEEMKRKLLFSVINERLSYMEAVAVYKYAKNKKIEDTKREAELIKKAVSEAQAYNLDANTAKQFLIVQMTAAKKIQFKHQATIKNSKEPPTDVVDLGELRENIGAASDVLIGMISDYLVRFGPLKDKHSREFKHAITANYLEPKDKALLFGALQDVQLNKTFSKKM